MRTSDRRGFALLTVLWLVALLGTVTGGLLIMVRREQRLAVNRITMTRARWAEDACLAILEARYVHQPGIREVDSTDLGAGSWCRATVVDLAARVNLNTADRMLLGAALGSDSLAEAVLDWRDGDSVPGVGGAERTGYAARQRDGPRNAPFRSVAELTLVRGFEQAPVARLESLFTVEGDGRINPFLVHPSILRGLPGLDAEAIHALTLGQPVGSLDELSARLSPASRGRISASYRQLTTLLTFQPSWLEVHLEAGVRDAPVRGSERVLLVPLEARLALVTRRAW
jgi:type II secretory pathway component PulK